MKIAKELSGGLMTVWIMVSAAAAGAQPAINPITSKVKNVPGQFFSINDHGTPSGFTRGSIDPTNSKHYQGITRSPSLGSAFFSSKSGDSGSLPAVLGIYMANEYGSRQMNHNLWAKGVNTTHGTNPISSAYTYWEDTKNNICYHFGGLQASGKILAVAAEECNGGSHGTSARVYFYNIHNTYWPMPISINADGQTVVDSLKVGFSTAGAAGIIEDSGNLYTVMVFTDGNKRVMFRQLELSPEGGSMTATSPWLTYMTPTDQSNGWETGTGAHQALNLIRQDNDALFVAGTQRGVLQSDYMFLYSVSGLSYDANGYLKGAPTLVYQGKRHIYCTNWPDAGSRMCDLQAAGGFYVARGASGNANGELILLAGAHDDDKGPGRNLAPITEFRNKNVRTIDANYGDCGTGSWATLYYDDHMDDHRNITITEYNSDLEDFKYLHNGTIDFGDKASAISYCIRPGCTMTAYNNSGYDSPTITISGSGSGTYGYDNDLANTSGGYYGTNWSGKGDKISSIKITCP